MKLVATLLVAVFVVASASLAFADCAGHNKAQMVKSPQQEQVKSPQQEQMTKEQPASTPLTVAEKAAEPAQPIVKTSEKK
jgi:hypothetical protein